MRRRFAQFAVYALSGFLLLSPAARSAEQHETGERITVPVLPAAPPMDVSLDGSWNSAAVFHLTHEATYRKPAPEDTVVHIGMYGGAIYVAFQAQQREP